MRTPSYIAREDDMHDIEQDSDANEDDLYEREDGADEEATTGKELSQGDGRRSCSTEAEGGGEDPSMLTKPIDGSITQPGLDCVDSGEGVLGASASVDEGMAIGAVSVDLAAATNEGTPEHSKSSRRPRLLTSVTILHHPQVLRPTSPLMTQSIRWKSAWRLRTRAASLEAHKCPRTVGNGNCAICTTFPCACVGGRQRPLCIMKGPISFVAESLDVKQNG
jgi:hypothetical protein